MSRNQASHRKMGNEKIHQQKRSGTLKERRTGHHTTIAGKIRAIYGSARKQLHEFDRESRDDYWI